MKRSDKLYAVGILFLAVGGAGLAEVVTSDRGSFLFTSILFSVGFACVLVSYTIK